MTRPWTRNCLHCKTAMYAATKRRAFGPDRIMLTLDTSKCPSCGFVASSGAQHDSNIAKIRALGLPSNLSIPHPKTTDEWRLAQEQIIRLRDAFNAGEPWDDLCAVAYEATLAAIDNEQNP